MKEYMMKNYEKKEEAMRLKFVNECSNDEIMMALIQIEEDQEDMSHVCTNE